MNILHENDDLDDGPDEELIAFYTDHCATSPKHVVLVTAFFPPCGCGSEDCRDDEESQISNVFSTHDAALDWIESLEDGAAIVVAPIVVDNPLFGNEAMN